MPWSNQNGGGPWGGGGGGGDNQGPWGQGPKRPGGGGNGGGNGGPPDIEDFFRKGQDQFKGMFPGGFSIGLVMIVIVVLAGFWVMQSVYTIQPEERGVELRFGVPKADVSGPGLHFMFWPVETVEKANITEQQLNIGSRNSARTGIMLTGDQNIVDVQFAVLYSVTDPQAYLFNVENPIETLQQVAESAMREVVSRRPAQDVFRDDREGISEDVKQIIQSTMDEYGAGLTIAAVSIEDAAPPAEVADAFDEVQRAEQDEDRFLEEANQYANRALGQARGDAAQIREAAAAYKDRVVMEALGEADRFNSIYETYVAVPEITRKRLYLETMQEVFSRSKNVIMDEDGEGVVPYLPLDAIDRNAAARTNAANTSGSSSSSTSQSSQGANQ
ncbi:FtsH protease activity modulator HflK [Martelella sp. AD-3]|uniref:FtsH protease activity modulator HflK n=1 Tax=Martelella sp. AD-3 TaxID=686597 RepID=UPI0004659E58|nr:FtsH protease activity modulator HflK [Martelella sp. AD-3]AMM84333.1 phage tail protein [Martelella sp. AD-3]MAM10748.1 HflK protein [Rhizobiaceae bacterium]